MITLPAIAPGLTGKSKMSVFNGAARGPRSLAPSFFYHTGGFGQPRFDDLLTIRALEETHTVSLPIDTIKSQVTTTPFVIRPTVENPSTKHKRACEELTAWLNGGFNSDGESFDHFLKKWATDVLSIDAGVLELVPDEKGMLAEMYTRDGATFVKNPDKHGRLPLPGNTTDPAYYQFGLQRGLALQDAGNLDDLVDVIRRMGMTAKPGAPIPFSRDQIVWTEENPTTWKHYGFGRVQKVRRLVEIVINQDRTNLKYFAANEVPEGVLNLMDSGGQELEKFRQYWSEEVAGKQHKMPIIGGKVAWIPFRAVLADLQFLESQNWYNKLVWMVFGLNQNEVGDLADVNRSTAQEQATTVFRRTTRPLLDLFAAELNTDILPFHSAWADVMGEVEFAWVITNPDMQAMERARDIEDLDNGIHTVNEIRKRRGLEPVPWGEMPKEVMVSFARQHPSWAAQHWGGLEDVPDDSSGGMFGLAAPAPQAKARPFSLPPR